MNGIDIHITDSNYDVNSKIFVWVNSDLDGAASVILLGNIFPNMEYRSVFFGNFLNQYMEWQTNAEDYDRIFIIGMPVDQNMINKVDDKRVIFVTDNVDKFNVFDSTFISSEAPSCCHVIYHTFKKKFEFTTELKKLVLYASDYNTYKLKFKESEYLNAIYRSTRYNRFKTFVQRFWNGYDGLTDKEIRMADNFFDAIETAYQKLDIYKGDIKGWKILVATTKESVNEIAKKVIDNHDADAIVLINLDTQFVSFRKPTDSPADIKYLAEYLCGGGGSEYAAGGNLNSKRFIDFTSKLTDI